MHVDMRRRAFIASVGALPFAGCANQTTTEREANTKPLDVFPDSERREVVGFFHGGQEYSRFGVGTGHLAGVSYGFFASASSEDGIQWLECTLEFTFQTDIRPPDLYLRGDTSSPFASIDRRSFTDEFTVLEIQESTDEFEFDFSAQPLGSSDEDPQEISMEVHFDGVFVDNDSPNTEYQASASIPATLTKS